MLTAIRDLAAGAIASRKIPGLPRLMAGVARDDGWEWDARGMTGGNGTRTG
jgi:hypothetical protein